MCDTKEQFANIAALNQTSMNNIFESLNPAEYDLLKEAVPLITILIAGADGNIDDDEISWAEKVTNIRSYSLPEEYREYYLAIGATFQERLDALMSELPEEVEPRQMEISRRLTPLNGALDKLEPKVAAALYDEWKSFARHVARASGGFLKFWSISAEEKRWIGLPMLTERVWHAEEAKEEE